MKTLAGFCMDCETRPDPALEDIFLDGLKAPGNIKNPEKIEAALDKKLDAAHKEMAVDTDLCQIICIGVKVLGEEPMLMNLREFTDWYNKEWKDEEGYKYRNSHRKMISFNGQNFDCVVMIKAAIKEGISDFPFADFRIMMDKYKGKSKHLDLMNEIGMVYGKNKSLDKYLQIYLGIKKTPIDFATASEEEVRQHNIEDLRNTELLYEKFKPLFV